MDVWGVAEGYGAQCGFVQSFGVQSVAGVVRRGRLRWYGHVEHKSGDDWVLACRNVVVAGVRWAGKGRGVACQSDRGSEFQSLGHIH